MATLTRSGVCYDLRETPFSDVEQGMTFYFSSHTHMLKFRNRKVERMEWLCDSLSNRFHVSVDARILALVQLYLQIEKRGFRVVDMYGCECETPDELSLAVC